MSRPIVATIFFFLIGLGLPLAPEIMAQDNRQLCKKFWPNVNTEHCLGLQNAARDRLRDGTYREEVVITCQAQSKIIDRVARYTNYYAADKCAIQEQQRLIEEEKAQAITRRNNAEADYYEEEARKKKEKHYHFHYHNNRPPRPPKPQEPPILRPPDPRL